MVTNCVPRGEQKTHVGFTSLSLETFNLDQWKKKLESNIQKQLLETSGSTYESSYEEAIVIVSGRDTHVLLQEKNFFARNFRNLKEVVIIDYISFGEVIEYTTTVLFQSENSCKYVIMNNGTGYKDTTLHTCNMQLASDANLMITDTGQTEFYSINNLLFISKINDEGLTAKGIIMPTKKQLNSLGLI